MLVCFLDQCEGTRLGFSCYGSKRAWSSGSISIYEKRIVFTPHFVKSTIKSFNLLILKGVFLLQNDTRFAISFLWSHHCCWWLLNLNLLDVVFCHPVINIQRVEQGTKHTFLRDTDVEGQMFYVGENIMIDSNELWPAIREIQKPVEDGGPRAEVRDLVMTLFRIMMLSCSQWLASWHRCYYCQGDPELNMVEDR